MYIVVFTPGLLKPVTRTHETPTRVYGYGFPRVRVRVQLEIPGGYPCYSLDLLKQVDNAIDIFESRTNGMATGLFMFDNAPGHQKRADDALSAHKLPKNPKLGWTHAKNGPKMRSTTLPDGSIQDLYFPANHETFPGWFKGMEQIIHERGLWPTTGACNLLAQCKDFKCKEGATTCCCRRILFTQPDFVNQKSELEEYIVLHGHICDFYPKFHCELNFIEQYWGAAKYRYRVTPRTANMEEMRANVLACLDDVPLLQIQRLALFKFVYYKLPTNFSHVLVMQTGRVASSLHIFKV